MKTSKFTEGQIAFVMKQAEDGTPLAAACRKAGPPRDHGIVGALSLTATKVP
jgi:hypothetical protein